MPDTKFSFHALLEHIRRFFWIYLVGIAVCLILTSLLWTTTRPQLSNEETVLVYLCDGYSYPDALEPIARNTLERTQEFDETLKSVEFQSLMFTDQDYTSLMVMMTRLAVGEGDAFLACQAAMDQLGHSQALEPLDNYVAEGWLAEYGLEPYYVTLEDEDTGESETYLAALKLDKVTALGRLGAFNNEGAYLCVTNNGGNVETTLKALEYIVQDLMEGDYAGAEITEPAA